MVENNLPGGKKVHQEIKQKEEHVDITWLGGMQTFGEKESQCS